MFLTKHIQNRKNCMGDTSPSFPPFDRHCYKRCCVLVVSMYIDENCSLVMFYVCKDYGLYNRKSLND